MYAAAFAGILLVGLTATNVCAALHVDGGPLDALGKAGAVVHGDVTTEDGRDGPGLRLSGGGIQFPTAGNLSAASGSVDLWCSTSDPWPGEGRQWLFHVGEEPHLHVSLFFSEGRLHAVYKGGEDYWASLTFTGSREWSAGEWHHVQFWWQPSEGEVSFMLRVDGEIVGPRDGRLIQRWPDKFFIGSRGPRGMVWRGLLDDVEVAPLPIVPPEFRVVARDVDVHVARPVGECYNFWSVSNFTSEDMFAEPRARERIRETAPFLREPNCVRLIGGRSDGKNRFFLGVDTKGQPLCDFTLLITYLQGILDGGWTPRLVLDNVPTAMSDPPQMHLYGNTYPPKDYDLYHAYIRALVQALVDEFGVDTVQEWRFRVMTEPDLYPNHWAGTKEEYLKLYDYAVDAVTSVLPKADIGPGNILRPDEIYHGEVPWGLDIIDHCATGTNYRTGERGTRMQFFSCSWYGRVGRSAAAMRKSVGMMRERLGRYPQFADLPVEIAEFAVLHDENGRRLWAGDATEWAGSWLAGVADMVYELDVPKVYMWATTCWGLPIPYTHTLRMLGEMEGGDRLAVNVQPSSSPDSGTIACRKGDNVMVLVYNHRPFREPKVAEEVALTVHDSRMRSGAQWRMSQRLVDAEHGVFMREFCADCEAAGIDPLPESGLFEGGISKRFGEAGVRLFRQNHENYVRMTEPLDVAEDAPVVVKDGHMTLRLKMPGHSVRFIELSPAGRGGRP